MRRGTAAVAVAAAALLVAGCSSGSTGAGADQSTSAGSAGSAGSSPGSSHSGTTVVASPGTSRVRTVATLHLPVGVSRAVVVAQGSGLLVLGGLAPGDSSTARVWHVDLRTHNATSGGSLALAVHDASGAALAGSAYVFGGGASTTVASVQRYAGGRASRVAALPHPRSDSAAAVVGTTAYVVGGFTGSTLARDILATTDGRTFRVVAQLAQGVRYPAVAAVGSDVFVVGGALATTEGTANGAQTAKVQRFDPRTGKVTVIGSLPRALAHATAFSLSGNLYVAGGRHGTAATSDVVQINLRTGAATRVGALPARLSDAAAAVVNGTAWLVGGETTGPAAPVSTIYGLRLSA